MCMPSGWLSWAFIGESLKDLLVLLAIDPTLVLLESGFAQPCVNSDDTPACSGRAQADAGETLQDELDRPSPLVWQQLLSDVARLRSKQALDACGRGAVSTSGRRPNANHSMPHPGCLPWKYYKKQANLHALRGRGPLDL